MNPDETPHGKLALKFVQALVDGDLKIAKAYLSETIQDDINKELEEMIEYGDGPVTQVEVINELTTWPQMSRGDIGWAYVAIAGSGFSEGIAVIISKVDDDSRITSIEWGRP